MIIYFILGQNLFLPILICHSDLEPGKCQGWVEAGYCQTEASVQANCQKSCGLCNQRGNTADNNIFSLFFY